MSASAVVQGLAHSPEAGSAGSGSPHDERPIRLLTFTTLYPNQAQPYHGLFVEHRLRYLVATNEVRSRVVAPVPWFPSKRTSFGRYARFAHVPQAEERYDLSITHPRFLVLPKIGMAIAPWLMASAVTRHVSAVCSQYDADVIDAHYFYPDGVAAAKIGRSLNRPVVITARGSDINLIAEYPRPRRQILWAAQACSAIIAVSEALKRKLIELGVAASKINVLRNGVDLTLFRPQEADMRLRTSEGGPASFVTVGNLVPGKGQEVVIRALASIPNARLCVIGDGPLRRDLERIVEELGMSARVAFVGQVDQQALVRYYTSADATILASAREGMPNVVLESLACGTPVIASAVGGIPEVMTAAEAGVVMKELSAASVRQAIDTLLSRPRSRQKVREFARRFDWEPTVRGQIDLYRRILHARGGRVIGER